MSRSATTKAVEEILLNSAEAGRSTRETRRQVLQLQIVVHQELPWLDVGGVKREDKREYAG